MFKMLLHLFRGFMGFIEDLFREDFGVTYLKSKVGRQEESKTSWQEMYKVFNMGHRMELYVAEETADDLIAISKSFGVDAQIIGHVEQAEKKQVTIMSEFGEFIY